MILKRNDIPMTSSGRNSSVARVRISENGQVVFNKLGTELIMKGHPNGADTVKEVYIDFDEKTRMFGMTLKLPKGTKTGEGFPASIKAPKQKEGKEKYVPVLIFSGMGVFRHIKYDFVKSGSQIFSLLPLTPATDLSFGFTLPTELPKRDIAPRKPRAKKEASANAEQVPVPEAELVMA